MGNIVRVVDSLTGDTTIIDLSESDEATQRRTVADILADELDPEREEEIEVIEDEVEEGEASDIAENQNGLREKEWTGTRYVAICIDNACVTHDLDFTEHDDLRDSVRTWTHEFPNRVTQIWQRMAKDRSWELAETVTSTAIDAGAATVVE